MEKMDRGMWNRWVMVSVALTTIIFIVGANSQKPVLGSAINMLQRYGHLAGNMTVMPRNVTELLTEIYRERSVQVFEPYPMELLDTFFSTIKTIIITFNVQIKFCSSVRKLKHEYFRGFTVAGVNESFRAFNSHWTKASIAKLFGIDESFVGHDYSYVFLKIARSRDMKKLFSFGEAFEIDRAVVQHAANVRINDTASADRFISQFGTHYVSSFATGDFIYQVFVVLPSDIHRLKQNIARTGLTKMNATKRDLMFSPRRTLHAGKILSGSGSPSLEAWARANLEGSYRNARNDTYWSIVKIYSDGGLTPQLDELFRDNALLRMELELLGPVFKCPIRRKWFEEHVRKRLNETMAAVARRHPLIYSHASIQPFR